MAARDAVSASAPKPKTAGGHGDLEDISISPVKNGFMVSERRAAKPSKRGDPFSFHEPDKFAFTSPEEVLVHVAKCLGVTRKAD